MLGKLRFMVRCGTSGSVLRGFSQQWVDDPVGNYRGKVERGRAWCALNGIAYEHMLYLPGGHLPGVMQFNGFPLLLKLNARMARLIARVFREIAGGAPADQHHSAYLGCLQAFNWNGRAELNACVRPYVCDGKSSLMIDKMSGYEQTAMNQRVIDGLRGDFAEVIGEGGLTAADAWMNLPICHTADAHETIYSSRPDKYLAPQHIIISNLPMRLREAPREEMTAWKREQIRMWRMRGVHVYIEVGDTVEGSNIDALGGRDGGAS